MQRPRVVILSNIEWAFIWQRHQSIATLFAMDHDVVFVELPGTRRIRWSDLSAVVRRMLRLLRPPMPRVDGVTILRPLVLPESLPCAKVINRWFLRHYVAGKGLALRSAILWVYAISDSATYLSRLIPADRLVYDCVDNFAALADFPEAFRRNEEALLRTTDVTLVPSEYLRRMKAPVARRVVTLPHGVFLDRFPQIERTREQRPRFKLVYYGHIHHNHFDRDLIAFIAELRRDWEILLVGPQKTPATFPRNVVMRGQVEHHRLIDFLRQAEVIILPYLINEYTNASCPAKIYECFATGLPIVSTPTRTLVESFGHLITFASSPEEFVAAISQLRSDDGGGQARVAEARKNTWDHRFREISNQLGLRENGGRRRGGG